MSKIPGKPRGPLSEERRAQISAATKAAMADPSIRAKISERTRAGMAAASPIAGQIVLLRAAWLAAGAVARQRFITEVFAPACTASAPDEGAA
ncbi:hypothetical protein [Bradyrhizobium sp. USDA 3364]